jgi:DNA-binding response OmpR family regulator
MRAKVLTIEDQPDIRRLIRMTLEFEGHEVIEAEGGTVGLAMARAEQPDAILLDVMMPDIDGISVAATLAADPVLGRIPTLMISALGTRADVAAGLGTGVHAYLIKPFSPWELLAKVTELVAEKRAGTLAPLRARAAR